MPTQNATAYDELNNLNDITASADPKVLMKRGHLKTLLNIPTGLEDVLLAHAQRKPERAAMADVDELGKLFDADLEQTQASYNELSAIAEAMRIDVRENLMSQAGARQAAVKWLQRSIRAFHKAVKVAHEAKAPDEHLGWIYAHLGASASTLYWLYLSVGKANNAMFDDAKVAFERAQKHRPSGWVQRFSALLYALRGGHADFKQAASTLEGVLGDDKTEQAANRQSLSVLFSRTAWTPPSNLADLDEEQRRASEQVRRNAARRSIKEGTLALQLDPEAHFAADFVATGLFYLHEDAVRYKQADEAAKIRGSLELATRSAWLKAQNQFSRACVTLASVSLLRAELTGDDEREARKKEAADFVRLIKESGIIDLEGELFLSRSPMLIRLLEQQNKDATEDKLSKDITDFQSNRRTQSAI